MKEQWVSGWIGGEVGGIISNENEGMKRERMLSLILYSQSHGEGIFSSLPNTQCVYCFSLALQPKRKWAFLSVASVFCVVIFVRSHWTFTMAPNVHYPPTPSPFNGWWSNAHKLFIFNQFFAQTHAAQQSIANTPCSLHWTVHKYWQKDIVILFICAKMCPSKLRSISHEIDLCRPLDME